MVDLTLPPGSRVRPGRVWGDPSAAARPQRLDIYRWSPEEGGDPRLDTYWIDRSRCGPMVLDALMLIRAEIDPTLVFRRSCREGICGSCSMNIDGSNRLACITAIREDDRAIRIYPLPHMRVIRDLVPDLSNFFHHCHATEPWLHRSEMPEQEVPQAPEDRAKLDGLYECILCACCSSACPSYWWNSDVFPGPAALLQAERWMADSRDTATAERLDRAAEPMGMFGCRQILNCAKACPKGLNPAKAIAEMRRHYLTRRS
jgi:succinate dehydrogenase / fumarate reductase iron-sulfur subunit